MPPQTTITSDEATELRALVHESLALSKENNHILHQMRFWGRVAFWAKVVGGILVVIGVPVLVYSYFQPLVNFFIHSVAGVSGTSFFGPQSGK